jgi:hypothetical protein
MTAWQSALVPVFDGVWEYASPGLKGQAVYSGNRFVLFITRPDSAPTTVANDPDQARLYRTLTLGAGTFSIADTIVTMNETHSKNPLSPSRTWRWSYVLQGDTITWKVLNAQGRVTNTGRSIRVRR